MNIVIDIRPLMGGKISGIEVYIVNLLKNLFKQDSRNRYILFANASKDQTHFFPRFTQKNVLTIQTKIPNKLLNFSLCLLKRPKLDQLIIRYLKRNTDWKDIDVIDLFFMPDLRLSALSKKTKKITVIHDLSFHHFPQFFSTKSRLWYKILQPRKEIKTSDALIAVSKFTKKDLEKTYHVLNKKIQVIHEGIEYNFCSEGLGEFSEIQKNYALPDKYFLFLSTLEPRKNMKLLIEAFKIYKTKNPENEIKLVMAGSQNKKIFSGVNIQKSSDIHFTGFIAEEDKALLMRNAVAFLYPSLFEGFGLPLLEAMKCETPIITSNTSSMPEIVGQAALLVNPNNIDEIVEAMAKIQRPEIRQSLQQKMSEQIKLFSCEKCAKETLELIRNVINS